MAWFGAKILFRHLNPDGTPACWEESVRLIQAQDIKSAERRAKMLGHNEEQDGLDEGPPGPQTLTQRFVAVLDVYDMASFPGGDVEVYSTMMSRTEAEHLREIYPPEDEDDECL